MSYTMARKMQKAGSIKGNAALPRSAVVSELKSAAIKQQSKSVFSKAANPPAYPARYPPASVGKAAAAAHGQGAPVSQLQGKGGDDDSLDMDFASERSMAPEKAKLDEKYRKAEEEKKNKGAVT